MINRKLKTDFEALRQVGIALLLAIGEDPQRPGLVETPNRFAKHWQEFIDYDPGQTGTVFPVDGCDEMVIVSGMRVYSYCEHHLLPFWCDISVGYIPADKILGLSKFARVAHQQSRRLQIQERLVKDISDELKRITGTEDLAVIAQGEHSCMSNRGIRTRGLMTSSVLSGRFKSDPQTRSEFFSLAINQKT